MQTILFGHLFPALSTYAPALFDVLVFTPYDEFISVYPNAVVFVKVYIITIGSTQ